MLMSVKRSRLLPQERRRHPLIGLPPWPQAPTTLHALSTELAPKSLNFTLANGKKVNPAQYAKKLRGQTNLCNNAQFLECVGFADVFGRDGRAPRLGGLARRNRRPSWWAKNKISALVMVPLS